MDPHFLIYGLFLNSRRRSTMTQEKFHFFAVPFAPVRWSLIGRKCNPTKVPSPVSASDSCSSNSSTFPTCYSLESIGGTRVDQIKMIQNIFSVYCRHDRFSMNRYLDENRGMTLLWRYDHYVIKIWRHCDVILQHFTNMFSFTWKLIWFTWTRWLVDGCESLILLVSNE